METQTKKGFVLLEVLIALLILSLVFTSLMKANIDAVRNMQYLENKTHAQWVAVYVANQLQAGLISLPDNISEIKDKLNMLNKTWYWTAKFAVTADNSALRCTITVSTLEKSPALTTLVAFILPPEQQATSSGQYDAK